jgi:hypothetical protein
LGFINYAVTFRHLPLLAVAASSVIAYTITRVTSSPGVEGQIVDSQTGAIIETAQVSITTGPLRTEITALKGTFLIRPHRWIHLQPVIPPAAVGSMIATGRVSVVAPGYEPLHISVTCSRGEKKPVDLQTIRMQRSAE